MDINIIEEIKKVIKIELRGLNTLLKMINSDYEKVMLKLFECKGKIVFVGIGKSGQIAKKIAATMASTGTPSVFLHPSEGMHGDLGVVNPEDVVIVMSKSGESPEINKFLPFVKRIGVEIISITGNSESTLTKMSDLVLCFGEIIEAGPFNTIPTTSTTVMLVLGDSLALILMKMKEFNIEDFAKYHPGGRIGTRLLLKVSDVMLKGEKNAVVSLSTSVKDMLIEITSKQTGAVSVVDVDNKLVGLITDFDIRKVLESEIDISSLKIQEIMNANPLYVNDNEKAFIALQLMQEAKKKHIVLPVVDKEKTSVGMLRLIDLVKTGL